MPLRSIAVVKTARYVVRGPEDGPAREVWMMCHGYGQLATRFARHVRAAEAPGRLVVVPEALSRFYVDPPGQPHEKVGASWMTREAREADITDVVRYLDDVLVAVCARAGVDPLTVPLAGLGFSQGAAIIGRWMARSPLVARRARRTHRLVLWGGGLPHDLDLTAERGWLRRASLTLVVGDRDPLVPPDRVRQEEARLRAAGLPFTMRTFPGEHRLADDVLRDLAGPLADA